MQWHNMSSPSVFAVKVVEGHQNFVGSLAVVDISDCRSELSVTPCSSIMVFSLILYCMTLCSSTL